MKKAICLLVAAAMAVTMLAGYAAGTASTGTAAAGSSETAAKGSVY